MSFIFTHRSSPKCDYCCSQQFNFPSYLPRHSIHIFSFIAIFQTFFSLIVGAGGIYLHWNMISEDGEKEIDDEGDDDDNSDDENENANDNEDDSSKMEGRKVRLILSKS